MLLSIILWCLLFTTWWPRDWKWTEQPWGLVIRGASVSMPNLRWPVQSSWLLGAIFTSFFVWRAHRISVNVYRCLLWEPSSAWHFRVLDVDTANGIFAQRQRLEVWCIKRWESKTIEGWSALRIKEPRRLAIISSTISSKTEMTFLVPQNWLLDCAISAIALLSNHLKFQFQ